MPDNTTISIADRENFYYCQMLDILAAERDHLESMSPSTLTRADADDPYSYHLNVVFDGDIIRTAILADVVEGFVDVLQTDETGEFVVDASTQKINVIRIYGDVQLFETGEV